MADRPNESLTNKFLKAIESHLKTLKHKTKTSEQINQKISSLMKSLKVDLQSHGYQHLNGERQRQLRISEASWQRELNELKVDFNRLYEQYEFSTKEEYAINRIETKAGWRNLSFRVGTTAAVAFTLGLTYTIAGNVDAIHLPLLTKQVVIHEYVADDNGQKPAPDKDELVATTEITVESKSLKSPAIKVITPALATGAAK